MTWTARVNSAFAKVTGHRLARVAPGEPLSASWSKKEQKPLPVAYRAPEDPKIDRLLTAPVFVISPVRSGSTLLRVLMDGHSDLHAPHEMHIRRLTVGYSKPLAEKAMDALGLERGDLEHLLWDRVLHREVTKSGKKYIVDKTPSNAFAWKRISTCWPDAQYVFLIRHPVSIARSWHEAHPRMSFEEAAASALTFMKAVQRARRHLTGVVVRYEDLTHDPERELRRICDHLGIAWEPAMLEYGSRVDGDFTKGLGDWSDKIRSGEVQEGRPLPRADDVPELLVPICRAWGYLAADEVD